MQVRFIVINTASRESTDYELILDEKITIGRHLGSPIVVHSDGISRHHFSIAVSEGKLLAEDLSSNGTSLNGSFMQPETTVIVKEGDILGLPGYELHVAKVLQPHKKPDSAQVPEAATPKPNWVRTINTISELMEPRELLLLTLVVVVGALVAFVATS